MKTITMHEAKTHLSRFVDEALSGKDVVITRYRKPVVRLTVYREQEKTIRKTGVLPGLIVKMSDDFNDEIDGWSEEIFPPEQRVRRPRKRKGLRRP